MLDYLDLSIQNQILVMKHLYNTEARWLFRGNVVKRAFWAAAWAWVLSRYDRKESQIHRTNLNDPSLVTYLSYLIDLSTSKCLNILSRSLQGNDATDADVDILHFFLIKLEIWETKLNKGNFGLFETLFDRQDTSSVNQMINGSSFLTAKLIKEIFSR